MNKNGPIIIIDDDPDDQELLKQVFSNLNYENEIIYFWNGDLALNYLNSTNLN